jgi:hypothetical protein
MKKTTPVSNNPSKKRAKENKIGPNLLGNNRNKIQKTQFQLSNWNLLVSRNKLMSQKIIIS